MKKKVSRESRLPPTAPIRASHISARAELTPPTANAAEVQENVTQANMIEIGRYLRWADKAMTGTASKRVKGKKGHAGPKAA